MIKIIDISVRDNAIDVLNIQIPSYMVEAEIIGTNEIPPLRDTVETLQECEEVFFGYYEDEDLCGAISLKIENNVVDIHRLIVHPTHFRKRIAQKLLNFVTNNYEVKKIKVATGSKNTPAVSFYIKNGFENIKEVTVNENLSLTFFEKKL
ncbi:GNAT family N-acetyltransferase [Psychrobacillus sp. FJAT-21963]|uniref:GNAT family N-acetyltransferase n=1 Tax=Psychrobacillus sp. FJAT-21963 TaxID=1712028 RepID=UPI0006F9871F|nr:GNAT family N-acetyltransferase [Psychrobacillus sp. FJAT-21963]KQL33649.1 GCN5 family acetyltransferase [Psychrobacillus sp. FJAT-21963]